MMEKKLVTWRKEDSIGIIKIDNPPVNALGAQVMSEVISCLQEVEADEDVRVVIIAGAGEKAFVAGADIKEFPSLLQGEPGAAGRLASRGHQMFNTVDFFSKPTIAAINGLALGGGCELALACDIRIASEKAQFGLPEIKLGIFPGGGGTQRLPRLVGEAVAKELMYLGNFISAAEALRIGLVNRVVAHEEVLDTAISMAKEIAGRPGCALQLIKQCVDRGTGMTLEEGLKLEIALFDRVFQSEDAREGVSAFLEKRPPRFKKKTENC